jgi:hypothetical protein
MLFSVLCSSQFRLPRACNENDLEYTAMTLFILSCLIMHHVVSATTNPAKIQAILQAFNEIFGEGSCHIESVSVESGVPEQPFGSEETRAGARNASPMRAPCSQMPTSGSPLKPGSTRQHL